MASVICERYGGRARYRIQYRDGNKRRRSIRLSGLSRKAADAGANAIVVSNHGGRVLDCCQGSVEVLPEIVHAVGNKTEVLIDGGFRRGTDILKSLALGAKAVLIGRPICWGLAAAGAEGVSRVLQILTNELMRAMMLTNNPDVNNVPKDTIVLS